MKGYIHSIETLGTVDGPGIRYVIFFQGCPMHCLYCHNPDTQFLHKGTLMSAKELLNDYNTYRAFLKNGGLTATGGEPLLQLDFLISLFSEAKQQGIHTCLDTSGICYSESKIEDYKKLLAHTDYVMLDIKHIDKEEHKKLTGHSNENILAFAHLMDQLGVSLRIRHVLVPEITNNIEQLSRLGKFLHTLSNPYELEVLPYHTMAIPKYEALQLEYPLKGILPETNENARRAKDIILANS